MNLNELARSVLIDAGARYGVHPTWANFSAEKSFHLFEVEEAECKRLEKKYSDSTDINVHHSALSNTKGTIRVNEPIHKGLSSALQPDKNAFWFSVLHPEHGDICLDYEVEATTIDAFVKKENTEADFLKIDTEGTEYEVLLGASDSLRSSILGIRCEVFFSPQYKNQHIFGDVQQLLLDHDFHLLNLGYDGKGLPRNEFTNEGNYGTLICCDAVWIKNYDSLFSSEKDESRLAADILKYVIFCLLNGGSDTALDVLIRANKNNICKLSAFAETKLYSFVRDQVETLFYQIKDLPGRKQRVLREVFHCLFDKNLRENHYFFQSKE